MIYLTTPWKDYHNKFCELHHPKETQKKGEIYILYVMWAFRIYSLNNLHIEHATVLIKFTRLYITSLLFIL